jgi:hypothetical protein
MRDRNFEQSSFRQYYTNILQHVYIDTCRCEALKSDGSRHVRVQTYLEIQSGQTFGHGSDTSQMDDILSSDRVDEGDQHAGDLTVRWWRRVQFSASCGEYS